MRRPKERIESMEIKNHSDNSDDSDEEAESPDEGEEDSKEVRVFKMLMKGSSRPRVKVPIYVSCPKIFIGSQWPNHIFHIY